MYQFFSSVSINKFLNLSSLFYYLNFFNNKFLFSKLYKFTGGSIKATSTFYIWLIKSEAFDNLSHPMILSISKASYRRKGG